MMYSEENISRIETILDYHVGKDRENKPVDQQLQVLSAKKRRLFYITIINILALVFFAYWFFSDMTQLSPWIFWVLIIVFILNLASISYQRKQIDQASGYLQSGGNRPGM